MKKAAMVIGLCLVMLIVLSGPALAAGSPKGAVKLALHERLPGDNARQVGSGPQVGWAIANTNANGQLIVQTHLDSGEPNQTFDVYVKINWKWYPADVFQLTTNGKGKGNAHSELDIADYPAGTNTSIVAQVVVKPKGTTAIIGYATAGEQVPLKK